MDARDWDQRYQTSELVWGAPPNEIVVELATPLSRGRAVDIGCGEGRNALWLATRGWQVEGIDFSAVALEKAAAAAAGSPESVRERLTWTCADLNEAELGGADGGQGADLALIVYIHLPAAERARLLRRAQDALNPGGALLVLGHHSRNLAEGVGGPQDPAILFSPDDVVAELDPSMRIEFARDLGRDTPQGMAIDALVFARKAATSAI